LTEFAACKRTQWEENYQNAISFIEYQPRVTAEHLLAQDDVHKIVARNHDFDSGDENAFDGWDTIQESKMVGTIFDVMNMFLGIRESQFRLCLASKGGDFRISQASPVCNFEKRTLWPQPCVG
jgi:hypothetical protein